MSEGAPISREALLREAAEEALHQEAYRRRFLYRDVEHLVEEGFLTHNVVFKEGCVVTLRSLTGDDLNDLLNSTHPTMPLISFYQRFVAKAIYKVDGLDVTDSAAAYWVRRLFVNCLPAPYIQALRYVAEGLAKRQDRAAAITEAYCYEPYSRQSWAMSSQGQFLTGSRGFVRRLWIAYNQREDARQTAVQDWEHTRAIVGVQSYKAAKKMGEQERNMYQREEDRRRRHIEATVNFIIRGPEEERQEEYVEVNGQRFLVPKVREATSLVDLEAELNRWIAGEKDFHDVVVQQYEANIRKVAEERHAAAAAKREQRRAMENLREQAGLANVGTKMVGYTQQDLKLMGRSVAPRTVSREVQGGGSNRLYDRYMKNEVGRGWLGEGGRIEPAKSVESADGDASTLQEKVAGRELVLPTSPIKPEAMRGEDG